MKPERWERLKALFQATLEQPDERRASFLAGACADDETLSAEVTELLRAHAAADSSLEHPPLDALAEALAETEAAPVIGTGDLPGEGVPGFRLLRRIGAGGMGVVFEAEQERPRRRVALKVLRGGAPAGDQRRRLFEREVEALARLRHPDIAAIYQSGQTEQGEPFFAMELAHGTTLGDALRGEGAAASGLRDLRERLRLFVRICAAVNYAHQRGVVHRDLKPANILVGPASDRVGAGAPPEVKILDFGLARVTDPEGAASVVTQVGTIQGTFAYMSPEQARGRPDDIDSRTDVYSLGVVLYELVAGRPPYELSERAAPEAIRIVCEEPPRPLREAVPRVSRDLETIVTRALQKDPAQRYQSALALGEEVERYLADEPILARPPSAAYQLSRLLRRHRLAFAAAAAVFLAVVGAAVQMTAERNRARAAEAQARREAARAIAIKDFLQGILASGDPRQMGRDARMLDVLRGAARNLEAGLPGEPDVEAALRDTLSEAFYYLGEYQAAREQAEAAVAAHERAHASEHIATLKSLDNLVAALIGQGEFPEAERLAREIVERKRRLLGVGERETLGSLSNLSAVLLAQGRFAEAEAVSREITEQGERSLPAGDEVTLTALNNLGFALRRQQKLDAAEAVLRKLVETATRVRGESHPETLAYTTNLVNALTAAGKLAEAEPLAGRVFEAKSRVLGPTHAETVISQSSLGLLLCRQGREEGQRLLREVLHVVEAPDFQGRHPPALYLGRLGACLTHLGRYPEAENLLESAYAGLAAALGVEDGRTRDAAGDLAALYQGWGRPAESDRWRARAQPARTP